MSNILAVRSVYPKYRYSQKDIMQMIQKVWPEHPEVINRLTSTSGVAYRNMLLPLENYPAMKGFESRNEIFIDQMVGLLELAVLGLREEVEFDWRDIGILTSTTVTGVAVPTLDARLMNRLPIPTTVIRNPLFGIGCLGGIAAMNRTKDLLKAYPDKLAIVLAAEACSLTFQFQDNTMANMVACSLFSDGTAAVLMAGKNHPLSKKGRLEIIDSMASFYPDTERIMGWDMVDTGFKVVLSGNVPDIVQKHIGDDARFFLERNQMGLSNINSIISHPGGPKVLKAVATVLEKDEALLRHSWESLRDQGNSSSVSVLNVLERSIRENTLMPGFALGLAMGPAFNSEMSLIKVGSH